MIGNMRWEEYLVDGGSIDFPYVSDVRVQDYTPGTDVTPDDIDATSDVLTINRSKVVDFRVDPTEQRQARADWEAALVYQSMYQLKNEIDQHGLNVGVSNAANTVTGGDINSSNILGFMNQAYATLFEENATDDRLWMVMDAVRATKLTEAFQSFGFNLADITLRNQFAGSAVGFDVYVTNNLPTSVALGLATNPSADDTITIKGVTFTFVAAPASAGDVDIGADAATSQANLLAAVNGGSGAGTTYIELSKEDRRKLQNQQVTLGAWASDSSTITAFGPMNPSSSLTAAADGFGTETSQMLAGRQGAISCAIQMYPQLYIRPLQYQIGDNYMTHTLYGDTVFTRDKRRMVKVTHNV